MHAGLKVSIKFRLCRYVGLPVSVGWSRTWRKLHGYKWQNISHRSAESNVAG